ncbi:MAG: flavin-dependent oxidoreductase [Erythrobacter sp.]|uniref:flavin-dependent oxidoreductase n=1 Tax=Erythrobacter sp. TaxID=1042 RepID=UPI00262940C2|nr:flavin-dependent oxidoreductase [Erythrobacter sp.]MDJ0978161.1 flavin-dependent oxidoreductase [Erythrobacter sp.]
MEIAIIGGGIAGLALALNLHRHGIGATVYEAAPEIREIGVGITLLPHAMRELERLGIAQKIEQLGVENYSSAFFNRFGQRIYAEERGRNAGYDLPECGIHRADLHGSLLAAVQEQCGEDTLTLDHQFVSLEQDETGVSLRFERSDGSSVAASTDMVLACDGVNSRVRQMFYPGEGVAFGGINTWRGVTRMPPILDGHTYMRIGTIHSGKLVIYPIRDAIDDAGNQLINWVAEIHSDTAGPNEWNKPGRLEDLMPIFGDWRFDWLDVPEMLRRADMIFEYPMVDRDPVDEWTFGRVTLVGDAAHPMYPRGSNGSAQAMIDARVLADGLADAGDPREALNAYAAERVPVTSRIVETNRTAPPDAIIMRVEELHGDRPFDDIHAIVDEAELRAISRRYQQIAGFARPSC